MSSTPRFFVPPAAVVGDTVTLPPDAAHHAAAVLRLRPGEPVRIHVGDGSALDCTLSEVTSKIATAQVNRCTALDTEPRLRITVAQALPKNADKLEQVLQHGTEIGAAAFVVFPSARSVARLEPEKLEKRLIRWRGIIRGAAEQSGRGMLPDVSWCASLPEATGVCESPCAALLLHEGATTRLAQALEDVPASVTQILVVVGPEGGFTENEVAGFTARGSKAISLGPRILRTETAALVALAQILFAREASVRRVENGALPAPVCG